MMRWEIEAEKKTTSQRNNFVKEKPRPNSEHIPNMNETTTKTKASRRDLSSTRVRTRSTREKSGMCGIVVVVAVCPPPRPRLNEDERATTASAPNERPISRVLMLNNQWMTPESETSLSGLREEECWSTADSFEVVAAVGVRAHTTLSVDNSRGKTESRGQSRTKVCVRRRCQVSTDDGAQVLDDRWMKTKGRLRGRLHPQYMKSYILLKKNSTQNRKNTAWAAI